MLTSSGVLDPVPGSAPDSVAPPWELPPSADLTGVRSNGAGLSSQAMPSPSPPSLLGSHGLARNAAAWAAASEGAVDVGALRERGRCCQADRHRREQRRVDELRAMGPLPGAMVGQLAGYAIMAIGSSRSSVALRNRRPPWG